MKLVKIGSAVINLDQVTCIRDLSDRDASGQVTRGLYRIEFNGGEAVEVSACFAELSGWLAANAEVPASPAGLS